MYRERKPSLRATITFKMTLFDTNVDKKNFASHRTIIMNAHDMLFSFCVCAIDYVPWETVTIIEQICFTQNSKIHLCCTLTKIFRLKLSSLCNCKKYKYNK